MDFMDSQDKAYIAQLERDFEKRTDLLRLMYGLPQERSKMADATTNKKWLGGYAGPIVFFLGCLFAWTINWALPGHSAKALIRRVDHNTKGIVILDASHSHADEFVWSAPDGCVSEPTDGGKRLTIFAPGEVPQKASLTVRSASRGRLTTDTVNFDFDPSKPDPNPQPTPPAPPGPGPGPGPAPGPSPGKYGLAPWMKAEVEKVLAGRATRVAESKVVAGVLSDVATRIAAGTISGGGNIASETYSLLEKGLGPAYSDWSQVLEDFQSKLATVLKRTSTDSDIADAWSETAAGLGAVK